jgi:hypothetical protein
MKYISNLIYLIAVIVIAGSCSSNKYMSDSNSTVVPISDKSGVSAGGLVYGLPLTVLDIEIEAERTIEKPGPYSRYAESLLGLTDIIKAENEYWSITAIRINTHQELDPGEFYVIEATSMFQTNVLALKKSGLILDLNPEIYNSKTDIFTDTETDLRSLRIYDLGADEYFQDQRDTVYRTVNVDTAFIKVPYLVTKKQKLTLDQLAEKAAVRLMEMRDGKHLILTGETNVFPQDGAAINEMNRLEKEYTELFTGKTLRGKHTFRYQVIPDKDQAGKQITVCTFSELTGPGTTAQKSGTPVTIELFPEMKTKSLKEISNQTRESSSQKYGKLYYRVPDVVSVKTVFGNEIINTSRKLIYQFGEVIRLPENYIIGK